MWFWSTQISSRFYKKLLIFLSVCLSGFILWFGLMEYCTRLLNQRMEEVEKLLKTEIGFPIQYTAIQPRWRWNGIVISMTDVEISEDEASTPFLSAKTLELGTNPYRLLFKQAQPFNHLNVEGMKMVLGWDKDKSLTVVGLKGGQFSSFDDSSLLKALSTQDAVSFRDSELLWQGPNTSIIQKIEGQLSWKNVKNLSWKFSGKQQIKINDRGEFWPVIFFTLQMDTVAEQLNIKASMERTRLQAVLKFPKAKSESISLDSTIEARDIDLRALHQNLILNETDPEWLRWLVAALERGSIRRGTVNIFGPLDHLDWNGEIAFHHVNLLYNQDWPRIRKANGKVLIERDKVKVQVLSGNILGSPLKKVDALIAPIGQVDANPVVQVEGTLHGRLENALMFLLSSPLKKNLGQHLNPLRPKGWMDLHLNLRIPIGDSKDSTEVQGQLGVEKGEIMLEALDLPMTHVTGLFRFTEKGVEAKGVTAELLDKPVQIEANPTRVTATTKVESEFLKEKFESPLFYYLNGASEMSVSYLNEGGWVIESSLQGMAIDLPAPLAKKADALQPIAITVFPPEGKESYYAIDAKGLLNATLTLETKYDEDNPETYLKRGKVVLGAGKTAEWTSNNQLSIGGEVPTLNIEEWKTLLNKESSSSHKLSLQINLLVLQLEAFGLSLKNTAIRHLSDNPAEWGVDGLTMKGAIILPHGKNKQLQFLFQYLKLNSKDIQAGTNSSITTDLLKNSGDQERIPIAFTTQSLTFDEAWFGETSFRLQPKSYGYEIQEVVLRNQASRLEGRGEWKIAEDVESSHLVGEVLSDNMSQTFAQWGFTSAMQEGKGRIQFDLQWPGSPLQVSLKKAQGTAELKLRAGHILGVNPGLGKILGLLSLENLVTRRLQLDFRDMAKKGFVFDKIEANMAFQHGTLQTDNLFIDGPAAKVKIAGTANLANKQVDLQMSVTPKVGNALPIAASLATGNPAIGVGVWVVDKLTGSKISAVSQKRYHVTGTWDAPEMNEEGKGRKR